MGLSSLLSAKSEQPESTAQAFNHVQITSCCIFLRRFLGFDSITATPKELWITFFIKLFHLVGFFILTRIMTLMLSDVFGYDDIKAGSIHGAYGALSSIYAIFSGILTDNYGIKRPNALGIFVSLAGRITLFLSLFHTTEGKTLLLSSLLFLNPFGDSLFFVVPVVALKRYTDNINRGAVVGIFFAGTNAAYLLSGIIIDLIRKFHNEEDSFASYKALLFTVVIFTSITVPLGLMMDDVDSINDDVDSEIPSVEACGENPRCNSQGKGLHTLESRPLYTRYLQLLINVFTSADFWRLIAVSLSVSNIKIITRYMDSVMPKYTTRMFGPDAPFGTLSAVNPAILILLGPTVTIVTRFMEATHSIILGMLVTSFSVIFLIIWPDSMWSVLTFIIIMSVGECLWAPRSSDFILTLMKDGVEGTTFTIASVPAYLLKLPMGSLSGYLLGTYCPKENNCNGRLLWGIIFAVSVISPLFMLLLWPILVPRLDKNKGQNEENINDGSTSISKDMSISLLADCSDSNKA